MSKLTALALALTVALSFLSVACLVLVTGADPLQVTLAFIAMMVFVFPASLLAMAVRRSSQLD